ncbi:MAG: hypothetical protein KAT37_00310 [Candidatus Aenigmarchaeota archaeon]|nr:hypothetical protein [Candidatus Aenigmarchaeota archaeon]
MITLYLPLAVLLVAGFLTPLIGIKLKLFRRIFVTSVLLFSFFFWIALAPTVLSGEILTCNMNEWPPPFGITLVVDSLSIVLLVVISGLSLIISPLIEKFIKERRSEFYSLFLLMVVGMTGIVITGDLFNLFVFTEIMVISSYALSIFKRDGKGLEAGLKYLIVGTFASSLILLGIALLYGITGTLNMADLILKIPLRQAMIPLGLILVGYLTEIGAVPFHFWKPDVAEGVSIPVAAMIVSVSTGVGVYALIRILFVFSFLQLNYLLMILGLLSMVVGAFMALFQEDLRRMLAYSSVSQMGYILFAFSLGVVGFTAGLFHLINNALLKMLLFLIIGSVIWKYGKIKPVNMPVTGACFLLASLGIAGIPPLNGFASKFLIYEAGFRSGFVLPTLVAIIVSVVTLAYYLKAFGKLFSGSKKRVKEDKSFLIPVIILTFFCIIMGLFPNLVIQVLDPVVKSLLGNTDYYCSVFGC